MIARGGASRTEYFPYVRLAVSRDEIECIFTRFNIY